MKMKSEFPDKPGCTAEGFTCPHCKEFFKWKKKSFRPQQHGGHIKNCRENPASRWFKGKREGKVSKPTPTPEEPTETPRIEEDSIEAEGAAHIDQTALMGMQQEGEPGPDGQPIIIQQEAELGPDHIPSAVVAEWVQVIIAVNIDLAIAYAKNKNMKKPGKLEMSSHTSKWLGQMISTELGPQENSWKLIIGAMAPYLATPWMSILIQSDTNILSSIMSRITGGQEEKPEEAEA